MLASSFLQCSNTAVLDFQCGVCLTQAYNMTCCNGSPLTSDMILPVLFVPVAGVDMYSADARIYSRCMSLYTQLFTRFINAHQMAGLPRLSVR